MSVRTSNILLQLIQAADYDVERAETASSASTVSTRSPQEPVPSITATCPGKACSRRCWRSWRAPRLGAPQGGRKHRHQEFIQIDTTNVFFIVAGAFAGLEKIVSDRVGKRGLGFRAQVRSKAVFDTIDHFAEVMPEDLIEDGLIPVFIGLPPVVASVTSWTWISGQILSKPKNALVKQYTRLFEIDNVELEFTDDALRRSPTRRFIAEPGPAGCERSWEEVMLPVMYDVPSRDDVAKVVRPGDRAGHVLPTTCREADPHRAPRQLAQRDRRGR